MIKIVFGNFDYIFLLLLNVNGEVFVVVLIDIVVLVICEVVFVG